MSIISKVENLVFREYDDTTIIYNLKLKNYVITNSVGSDIWQFICNTHLTYIDSNDIINHICSIYDENPKHIGTDIEQFIIELYDANIIYVDGKRNTEKIPELSSPSERDIEGEIIEIMRAKNQIYSATFELTYECNEKCVHCYATYTEDTPKKKVLTLEKCKELIDELYEIKCFHLVFTGGDPFVFDGFMELLEYAHKKQFTFDVYTNALEIFHHPEYISQIQKLYPRTFYISLYGSTAETHETITQIKGSFTKTIRAIKMLRAADIAVVLNVMMMKPNYQELPLIIELSKALHVEYRVGLSLISKNNGDVSPLNYFINEHKIIEEIILCTRKDAFFNMDISAPNPQQIGLMCGAGTTALCFSPDGKVYPCVSLKYLLGSIFDKSIQKIWYSDFRKKYVFSLTWENAEDCKSCELATFCRHCIGISYSEYKNSLKCNSCDKLVAECVRNVT